LRADPPAAEAAPNRGGPTMLMPEATSRQEARVPSSHADWTDAQWVRTAVREPSHLAELGIPLRCFRPDRGYFFACYLPERGWYWAGGAGEVEPERWAVPTPRSSRRSLPS
jgi:hypothetical protein